MSLLEKIKTIEKADADRLEVARIAAETEARRRKEKLNGILERFYNQVIELHNQQVNGHTVTIIRGEGEIKMMVDGIYHAVFTAEETVTYCNCSQCYEGGQCSSPGPFYSYHIKVEQPASAEGKYIPFESISEYEIQKVDSLAEAMIRLVRSFRYRSFK